MKRLIPFAIILASLSLLAHSAAQSTPPKPSGEKLPDGPGKQLVERECLNCHNAHSIVTKRASADDWADEVDKMAARGAVLSDEETDQVVQYLATHFGPDDAKSGDSGAKAGADQPTTAQPSSTDKTAPH
jgi:mono/diheme cytochrome c family protein